MRVVLADGSDLVRRMLRRALSRTQHIEVVADTPCGRHAYELVDSIGPEALVTEVDLMTCSGIELTRRVSEVHPEVAVVAYSSQGDAEAAMLEAGARVFVMKGEARLLIDALSRI